MILAKCQNILENADNPEALIAIVDVIMLIAKAHPSCFNRHFKVKYISVLFLCPMRTLRREPHRSLCDINYSRNLAIHHTTDEHLGFLDFLGFYIDFVYVFCNRSGVILVEFDPISPLNRDKEHINTNVRSAVN